MNIWGTWRLILPSNKKILPSTSIQFSNKLWTIMSLKKQSFMIIQQGYFSAFSRNPINQG